MCKNEYMKRIFKYCGAVVLVLVSVLSLSCSNSGSSSEKPKYLWMAIDANFDRFSHKDSICYYLDKAVETGFNHIVVDVRGVEGSVLYDSEFIPKLTKVGNYVCDRDWDYLQYFIGQAKKRKMGVTVSATVFPAGSPYHNVGPVYDDPGIASLTCHEYTPDGMKKIEDDHKKVAAFMNPVLPESQKYALDCIRELVTKYDFDGYCLDYCRFPDAESDFSDATRKAFEEYIGVKLDAFPGDVFTYAGDGTRIPGKYYKQWWEFRGKTIRDFIAKVRELIDAEKPSVKLEYWAASWLHALYTQGQNWASPESRFYEEYLDDWATPTYYKTAFGDLLDTFITGTYLERVWGMDDLESIEYGLHRTLRDVQGACSVYGSLYAQNYKDFDDAVYLCLSRTEGLMVFDIVQVIENSLWDEIKAGIDRAESEVENK